MELIIAPKPSPFTLTAQNRQKILFSPRHAMRHMQCHSRSHPLRIALTYNALPTNERRSANYHPTIWNPELIDSLCTPYSYEDHAIRLDELKQGAKKLLISTDHDPSKKLKLIDSMQRLGLAYHFEKEIQEALDLAELDVTSDLYTTSLRFRLLRQNGFHVSTDLFQKFRTKDGKLMESLSKDGAGLLSLYEASHLGEIGEDVLEEGYRFSKKHLKSLLGRLGNSIHAEQVQQSLVVPLHWRMPRDEARNFIDTYAKDDERSLVLLELAKLDYNLVQSIHQSELKELARWWRDLRFKEKLSFSRDRLMENYLWAMGIISEPQSSKCRIGLTKFVCILTAIDDMYDIYGRLDELELFTDAVNRWEASAIDDMPEYMKLCYLAMFNFANGIAYDVMKDHGLNSLPWLAEQWAKLCRSYLVEARWFYSNYTPTLDEYLENAWISVGGPAALLHASVLCNVPTKASLDSSKVAHGLIHWSSLITRLSDDLGTSKAEGMRGDVKKSLDCYMIETGATEEEARDHIESLIRYSWKKLNEESGKSSLPKSFVNLTFNMARTAQCIFQHGDGIGSSTRETKDRLISLLVQPVPVD